MTVSPTDPVGQRAQRDDYASMAALARSLLEAGESQDAVLRACYGVPFPEETFALAEMIAEKREPNALYNVLPWNLLVPLDRGGPPVEPPGIDQDERRVYALDPTLVPLMLLYGDYYEYSGTMLCYRLDDLSPGRSTIWGLRGDLLDDRAVAKRYGDSLAAVLHADAVDRVRRIEAEYASPANYGAGSVDQGDVEYEKKNLASVEELMRRVAERRRPQFVR